MAFEVYVGTTPANPEHTTIEQYNISRLGRGISVNSVFTETIDERVQFTVLSAEDPTDDGLFEVVRTTTFGSTSDSELPPLSGSLITTPDGTWVGHVRSTEFISEVSASASSSAAPSHCKILLSGGLTSNSTPVMISRRTNTLGNISHVPAPAGRQWVITLRSDNDNQKVIMQGLMMKIMIDTITVALEELGVSKTPTQIFNAAMGLAGRGINIDSLIVDELETLEKGRRSGDIPESHLQVSGNAPKIS